MFHKFKLAIIGALMVLASAAASYAAVSAAMSDALLPAGSTRFAAAHATGDTSVEATQGWVDLQGMTKYITIPTGKTADVMVHFCGQVFTQTGGQIWTRVLIRNVVASPSELALPAIANGSTFCSMFYKTNVAAGSPPVKLQWKVAGSPGILASTYARTLFVIVNIH
jgi:hypothetical protein